MSTTKVIITVVIIIVVILGLTYIFNVNQPLDNGDGEGENEVAAYFQDQLTTRGVEDIGQPIEGFDPNLLILAFPELEESDFQGVEALEGHYEFQNGTLEFVRDQEQPITSAERMVTEEGYETLLQNVSARLNVQITDEESVDSLVALIDTGERIETKIDQGASALDVTVVPLEVLEDSRCPSDATCVQAGTVRVRTMLTSGLGEAEQIFTLNQPITTEAEEVTLIQVDPQNQTGITINPADYTFIFEVTKRDF